MNEKKESNPRIAKGDFCYNGLNLCIAISNRIAGYETRNYNVVMLTGPDKGKVVPSGDYLLRINTEEAIKILKSFYNNPTVYIGDFVTTAADPRAVKKVVAIDGNTLRCVRLTGPEAGCMVDLFVTRVNVIEPEAAGILILRTYEQ